MKTALAIFALRHSFATSLEEIPAETENFESAYSTDETRFSCNTVTIEDELFESLTEKVGSPDFRVKLVASNATPNGQLNGKPTTYVFVNVNGELKVKSEF